MSNPPKREAGFSLKKRIVQRAIPTTPDEFPDHFHPLIRRICAARKVASERDLDHGLKGLPHPGLFSGMAGMVEHLIDAIKRQSRILIVADFDADGATSCVVAKRGLEMLGARNVLYTVPDRFRFGYGLTPEIVALASERNPDLILTVDNGISSIEGVAAARERGIKVLITDHHLPGSQLPDADAIVNPNLRDDPFPGKSLAGVGVMFYVLAALRSALRDLGSFQNPAHSEPNLAELLDLVALGTVADVVELDHINRIFVHQGLKRIRLGAAHPGVQALIQVAGKSVASMLASDLGFSIGPRLNAAGRLENMAMGIECLLAEDFETALPMAERLDALNRERREIESRMQDQAIELLDSANFQDRSEVPAGLCLHDERWHQGVVGIIASRIKERFNRPVIAFASAGDGLIKGSARSVHGIHMRDVLSEIATLHPHLLNKFGGHAMAAGLSLRLDDLAEFSTVFAQIVQSHGLDLDSDAIIATDGALDFADFTIEFAEMLNQLAPWGQGFPEPSFHGEFDVLESRVLKDKHVKLTVCLPGHDECFDAIAFSQEQPGQWLESERVRLVYRLQINEFRGNRKLQLKIEYMEAMHDWATPKGS